MKKNVLAIAIALAGGAVSTVQAAETAQENIIVSASRLDEDTQNIPTNVTVLTAEDIKASAAKTLPELLALEAGVLTRSLYGNNAARATVDIRGFGAASTQNTLVLLDGRRLNDIDLAGVDYAAIPLNNIERVEIIRGGGAVLYGDGAAGGAINIITKRPGRAGVSGNVTAGGGTYNSGTVDAVVSQAAGAFSYNIAANGISSDGYRDNNELEQKTAHADFRLTQARQEFFLKLGADDQELELPGARLVDPSTGVDELETDRRGSGTPNDFADQTGHFVTAGITRYLAGETELIIDLGLREKEQQAFYDDYFGSGFSNYLDTELSTWSFTPRLKTNYRIIGLPSTGTVGVDYYLSDYDSERALNPDTRDQPIHRLDIEQTSIAVYGHNRSQLSDKASLTLGLRYQEVDVEARDTYDQNAPKPPAPDAEAPDEDTSDKAAMYTLGLLHRIGPRGSVFGNFEQSTRFATVDELYDRSLDLYVPLDPQRARSFTLGTDYQSGPGELKLSAYYMRLEDEIHYSPATFSNVNLDPTKRYGLELLTRGRLAKTLTGRFNYTFMRSRFRDGPFEGNDVPLVPTHSASLSLLWSLSERLRLSIVGNYVGSKRFDNDQENTFEKIPAYKTADLKLTWTPGSWTLAASANNVFDEEYFDYGIRSTFTAGTYNAYPLPERNYFLSVGRDF